MYPAPVSAVHIHAGNLRGYWQGGRFMVQLRCMPENFPRLNELDNPSRILHLDASPRRSVAQERIK